MKVLLACPYALDLPGGVQVHVRDLADALRSRGHDVAIVAPAVGELREADIHVVGRPVRVRYAGTVAPICPWPASAARTRAIVRALDPDIVHVHEPYTPSTSMFAALASRAPVVATFHAYLGRSRLAMLARPMLAPVRRAIDARIAVSEAAASFAAITDHRDKDIVPNGVDVATFAAGAARSRPRGRTIAWVNRLDPQKGFRVMVEAFALLAAQLPDVRLLVAGDGAERASIDALGAVARQITMLGTVPHERLPAMLAEADAFAAPAVGQESFGIVLVEAMAAGLPVVATDIPGYREVVRDGVDGLLVPPGDPRSLAEALRRVLTDDTLASRLRDAGKDRARGYSWDRVVPRIEAVYERALATPARG